MGNFTIELIRLMVIAERTGNKRLKLILTELLNNHYSLITMLHDTQERCTNDDHVITGQVHVSLDKITKTPSLILNLWYSSFFNERGSTCDVPDPMVFILPIETLDIEDIFPVEFKQLLMSYPQKSIDVNVAFNFRRYVQINLSEFRHYIKNTHSFEPDRMPVKNALIELLNEYITTYSNRPDCEQESVETTIHICTRKDHYDVIIRPFFSNEEDDFEVCFKIKNLSTIYSLFTEENVLLATAIYSLFTEENVLLATEANTGFSIRINFIK